VFHLLGQQQPGGTDQHPKPQHGGVAPQPLALAGHQHNGKVITMVMITFANPHPLAQPSRFWIPS
jgi:hypothetical protein